MKQLRIYILLLCGACLLMGSCSTATRKQDKTARADTVPPAVAAAAPQPAALTDEEQFDAFFDDFSEAVKKNDSLQLGSMLYFPLQTAPQWWNADLKNRTDAATIATADLVPEKDFPRYCGRIFNEDVRRLLPQAEGENLDEVAGDTDEDYYLHLRRCTDPSSKMYQVYMQYAQEGRNTEGYFGFVFGKVNGHYKAVSYFSKWPVKD